MTDPQEERIEALEKQMDDLEARIDAISTRQRNLADVVLGERELHESEVEAADDVFNRMEAVEASMKDVEEAVAIVHADGGMDEPDARAQRLRQVLLNKAKSNDGKARLERDDVDSALGGGYHKTTVLDAMRRAAEGDRAKVHGTTELEPVDGIEFHSGNNNRPSKIEIDLADVTLQDLRHNVTTRSEPGGV